VATIVGVWGALVVLVALTASRVAPVVLALAAAIAFASLPYGALAASTNSSVRRMAAAVRDARQGNEEIGTYKVFVRNLVFYSGLKQTDLIHDEHVMEWLSRTGGGLMVLRSADAARLEQDHQLTFERLAAMPYFDEGGIRLRTLLWPDRARDVEEVILVRVTRR